MIEPLILNMAKAYYPSATISERTSYDKDAKTFVISLRDVTPSLHVEVNFNGRELRQNSDIKHLTALVQSRMRVAISTIQNELAKSDPLADILQAVGKARQKEDKDQDKFLALVKSRIDKAEDNLLANNPLYEALVKHG